MTNHPELWLERFWPSIAFFHGALLFVAVFFGFTVFIGGSPVTPELYGPAVYAIPALWWSSAQAAGASVAMVGALLRGYWGALACVVGSAISVLVYGFFAAAASLAEQGTIVQAATLLMCAPGSVLSLIAGLGALRNGGRRQN